MADKIDTEVKWRLPDVATVKGWVEESVREAVQDAVHFMIHPYVEASQRWPTSQTAFSNLVGSLVHKAFAGMEARVKAVTEEFLGALDIDAVVRKHVEKVVSPKLLIQRIDQYVQQGLSRIIKEVADQQMKVLITEAVNARVDATLKQQGGS